MCLLASLRSSTGRNYQVHRVYCYEYSYGSPASYTNSIILNDHIYVPFFGNATHDEAALESYRQAAPGYQVSGYYYSGFLSDDALHCRTKGVMDTGMLRVGHIPVQGSRTGSVPIDVTIRAHSGLPITTARIHYRHGEDSWQVQDLQPQEGDVYQGIIPSPAADSICQYYIAVFDESGRSEGMPRTQPAASYSFQQLAAVTPVDIQQAPAALHPNYPNPFNPSTTFSFELKFEDDAELVIIDARGRLVRVLVQGVQSAGMHEVAWDGTDDQGRQVASGVYYYRLRAAGLQYTRAATLLK